MLIRRGGWARLLVLSIYLVSVATPASTSTPAPNQLISEENARHGTSAWLVPYRLLASAHIQAYASATSVQSGDTLIFYVSVLANQTSYSVDIYRLGWYGGAGGRLMLTTQQIGTAQGYYGEYNTPPTDCPTCTVDRETRLVEANWKPSFALTIPATWVTGMYEAKFTEEGGTETYLTFVVRGNINSTFVAVTDDTTVAAYNHWGGYSLYAGIDGTFNSRARKVSLNRPMDYRDGQGLPYEICAIRWLEQNGYDVSYLSSTDMHEHPSQILQHRVYISLGHDEYWSKEMRDGVESARDAGVSIVFMGANAVGWQMRFEPDRRGVRARIIVCYKDASLDPLSGVDNARVTVSWRDAPLSRPENSLIGIMYSSYSLQPHGFPWKLDSSTHSPLLAGTGLQPGHPYGCEIVGYEWDRTFDNGDTPAGLHVLGSSPVHSYLNFDEASNTTYYVAKSGALVFASGSIYWSYALDSTRLLDTGECPGTDTPVPGLQKLMANVLAAAAAVGHQQ